MNCSFKRPPEDSDFNVIQLHELIMISVRSEQSYSIGIVTSLYESDVRPSAKVKSPSFAFTNSLAFTTSRNEHVNGNRAFQRDDVNEIH